MYKDRTFFAKTQVLDVYFVQQLDVLKPKHRKEQIKVLEKYINMWNPLNFVTEEEVLELIEKNKLKNANTTKTK